MPGPMSAPAGQGRDVHRKCMDRESCTGAGCRIRTGKTYHDRTGEPTAKTRAELAAASSPTETLED